MNLLVCVKQVPQPADIKMNTQTNRMVRTDSRNIVNPFDAYALEIAAGMKDENPDTKIVVLTMGPETAKSALRECLSVGADQAYLISDPLFSGADTLATSDMMAAGIRRVEEKEGKFDIIFCGKQAIDGNTSHVGPQIAERMHYPQITGAVQACVKGNSLRAVCPGESRNEILQAELPCLLTVGKTEGEPRFPTVRSKMRANRTEIPILTAADLKIDGNRMGTPNFSITVNRTIVNEGSGSCIKIREETEELSARKLAELLIESKIL